MARGGRAEITIGHKEYAATLEVVMAKVGRATKKATVAACEEILETSLMEVPRETNTLAESAFMEIRGNSKTGFEGTVGYGGQADPINPKSGMPASSYMVVVHEDLSANHPIGKAKFLEDPTRAYQEKLSPTVQHFMKNEF